MANFCSKRPVHIAGVLSNTPSRRPSWHMVGASRPATSSPPMHGSSACVLARKPYWNRAPGSLFAVRTHSDGAAAGCVSGRCLLLSGHSEAWAVRIDVGVGGAVGQQLEFGKRRAVADLKQDRGCAGDAVGWWHVGEVDAHPGQLHVLMVGERCLRPQLLQRQLDRDLWCNEGQISMRGIQQR